MKLLKLLTIFILTLFPLGELLRFDIGNYLAWKPLDLIIFFTVIAWLIIYRNKLRQNFQIKYFLFPLVGLFALLLNLSWLKPTEAATAFLYLLRWVMYAGLFFVVREFDTKFKQKIKLFFFIDGLLMLLFGFIQYFFYNSLRNLYYLGWDDHMHRIFSTFLDPNFAGGFFVLYFIFVAGMLVELFRKLRPAKNKQLLGWIFGLILFFTLLAIFLTFSRAAILMLIVSSVIFLILIGRKKLIIGIMLAVVLFGIAASPFFNDENMNLFRVRSSKARLYNYSLAIQVIADRPLLGVGFNSYRYTKRLYGIDHDWVNLPSHADAGADNSFLFILATTGVVGFGAYLYLWFLLLKKALFLYKKKSQTIALVVMASTGGLFVHALFINSLFFAPFMLWLWVLLALMKDN